MIKVVSDIYHLVQVEKGKLVLSKIEDYVQSYDLIIGALEKNQNLVIYIHNPTIETWIKRMSSRYPQEQFDFQIMDARKYLEHKWQTSIPDFVSNDDIMNLGLLEVDIEPRPGNTFENIILQNFYDPVFTSTTFPSRKIIDILFGFNESLWKRNAKYPLIYRIYMDRLNVWRNKARDKPTIAVIDMIEEDISSFKIELMKYKVLRSYPKLGDRLLGKNFKTFNLLKLNLRDLEIDESAIPEVIQQIEYHLNSLKIPDKSNEAFEYISNLSGLIILEFEKVESFLQKKPELIALEVLGELKAVFHPIINRIQKRIEKIKLLLKPPTPEKPELTWTFEKMMNWAIESYLPFFVWADSNEFIDENLMEKADQFALWLYSNWEELRAHSKQLIFNVLPNSANTFRDKKIINLMVIIDNLGWRFSNVLKNLFQDIGFSLHLIKPYLSMLPSATEISKKCLLSGSPTYKDIDEKKYAAIVEKGWIPYFDNSKFLYIQDLNKLLKIPKIEYQTYVVNYLPIDKSLHQPESVIGLPHDEHIRNLLSNLVEKVSEFIKRFNLKDEIVIHIVSDHGSTKISNNFKNSIDISFFKHSDFEDVSPRVLSVKTERFKDLPDSLREDCFFIEQNKFGNDRDYLCARKSNRFTKINEDHYIHGGLSPEEMIVPYMVCKKITKPVEYLTLFLIKTTYRYRLEVIELEISNPNEYPVENVVIETLNSNIEAEPFKIDWLDSKRKFEFSIQGRFKKTLSQDEIENLSLLISFECNGKEHKEPQINLPITMKSMFELKDKTIFDDVD